MIAPTCQQIYNDELGNFVYRNSDASWRHGTYETQVFHRESDNTFWEVAFRLSTDGETNELREGYASIRQVTPIQKMITVYE